MEILCKTGHACTYADTQVSNFYGHVMLGLRIHFLYFSQPNVSKICSFINLCIHPSPFWVLGKISQHSPFRCTHIFFQQLTMISEFFFKEELEVISFRKHVGFFQLDNLLFFSFSSLFFLLALFFFFSYLLSLFFIFFIFIFIMIFVCFIFWTMFLNEELYMVPEFQINIIDNNDISTNATIQTKMYALYK